MKQEHRVKDVKFTPAMVLCVCGWFWIRDGEPDLSADDPDQDVADAMQDHRVAMGERRRSYSDKGSWRAAA